MFGIDGYQPRWYHRGMELAAAHRTRAQKLLQQRLVGAWLMWDLDADRWYRHGPVVLGFEDTNVEIAHRTFDECTVTWDEVDLTAPLELAGRRLDWRGDAHPALRTVAHRRLVAVNVVERLMPAPWRPTALHAVELLFEGPARLAIFNALDENGLTDADEVALPIGHWRRIPVA